MRREKARDPRTIRESLQVETSVCTDVISPRLSHLYEHFLICRGSGAVVPSQEQYNETHHCITADRSRIPCIG